MATPKPVSMTNQGENTPRRGVIVPGLSNGDYLKPQSNARYDELMRKLVLVIAFEAAAGGVTQVLTDALLLWFWITVMVGFPLVLYWREIKTWLRGKWFLPKTKKEKLQSLYPMFERVLELDRRITAEQDFDDVSGGPHHQDSGEAKIRESTAGVSRKPSSDGKARGCSSKHLCGLTAWNT